MALGVALGLCWGVLGAAVADGAHRWDVRVTGVTGEDGSHRCAMVGQLDDFRQMDYSTARQQVKPTGAWMAQAVGQAYFQAKTRDFLYYEKTSKLETGRWMRLNNHTGGSHVMQVHVGCTMEGDIPTGARFQYAYDGRDFISFDTRTGTWVAAVAVAVPQKRRWDTEGHWNRFAQWYLQRECLETLRSLVRVGKETLERQVPPEVSVSRRDAPHGFSGCFGRPHVARGSCSVSPPQCPPRSRFPAETPPTAPSPSPAAPAASTRVPSTSSGCGTEATSWRRRAPAGSCPSPTAPTTPSRPWRSARGRTGPATPAGWSTAACLRPSSSGPLRRDPCPPGSWPPSSWPCWVWLEPQGPASGCGGENQQERREKIQPPARPREQSPGARDPGARGGPAPLLAGPCVLTPPRRGVPVSRPSDSLLRDMGVGCSLPGVPFSGWTWAGCRWARSPVGSVPTGRGLRLGPAPFLGMRCRKAPLRPHRHRH
ncbi:uncharacterized protein LOC142823523 isoform X2 [Pelodiscus sinensis]|uniref:uncharacterized protein LOC142823523 isoform X2 n=1 Tax=Pelodiscus sinensis TaxID=13735 RepID=UPI003F6BAEDF